MPSYYIKNGKKKFFRFVEIRSWDESQEYYANELFKFKVNENDLLSLGFIYWAHIAIWQLGFSNEDTIKRYPIKSFEGAMNSKLGAFKIEADPPSFGYNNPNVSVDSFCWDYPEFKVINISPEGIFASDNEFEEFYFDLNSSDICSVDDLQFDEKELKVGAVFTCDPGDPVFMDDNGFSIVRQDFISKIETLNNIYSAINFPYLIEIESIS